MVLSSLPVFSLTATQSCTVLYNLRKLSYVAYHTKFCKSEDNSVPYMAVHSLVIITANTQSFVFCMTIYYNKNYRKRTLSQYQPLRRRQTTRLPTTTCVGLGNVSICTTIVIHIKLILLTKIRHKPVKQNSSINYLTMTPLPTVTKPAFLFA